MIMIVAAVVLGSCMNDRKPDDVLNKEQMANFLIEVYLAEARLSTTIVVTDSARHIFESYEKVMLQRRGIPDSVLKKSYSYYLEHPKEMEEIMTAVIDSLSLRERAAVPVKPQ